MPVSIARFEDLPVEETPVWPMTPAQLGRKLAENNIKSTLYTHRPVFTVAEGHDIKNAIQGGHCRNLFIKDKKDNMALVTALNETEIDLKALSDRIGFGRISFGSAERLENTLGIKPGSVTPFAILNDREKRVINILDEAMFKHDVICVHPLINNMTIALSPYDLQKFLTDCGYAPRILAFN